jgi:DNA-binding GntR family transcriptional regulator
VVIDHGGPEYLYLQLADLLRAQIRSGELPPRSRVPSLTDLAAEHGLADMTVRKALKVLVDEGLIETRPGRGTFVKAPQ